MLIDIESIISTGGCG